MTTSTLGPDNATLTIRTGKTGAASKAGHNLVIEVTAWNATLELGETPQVQLSADSRSLRVLDGTGGIQALGEDDKDAIKQTIDDEVLCGTPIEFHSTGAAENGGTLEIEGDLTLSGTTRPVAFELGLGRDGRLTGSARIKQSDWGMKPYSTLFGTLKVADEVEIAIDAPLPSG
jgi:YceI-like domain